MDTERVREHFEAISSDSGFLSDFDMENILKTLLGKPLEAMMPGVDSTAILLDRMGHVADFSAMETAEGIRAWSPTPDNQYRRCLVMDTPEGMYAVMLHLDNEPSALNKDIDDMFDKMRAKAGLPPIERDITPGSPNEIVVCRIWPDAQRVRHERPNLTEALAADADEEAYLPSKCFSRRESIGGIQDDHPCLDMNDGIGGDGMDIWPTFFGRLAAVATRAGAADALDRGLRRVQARKWKRPDREGLESLAACEAFVDELHAMHGLLLGEETADAVKTIQGMAMEVEADQLVERMAILEPMLREGGHLSEDDAYRCNDDRNLTWLDMREGMPVIVFSNQSRVMCACHDDDTLLVEDLNDEMAPVRMRLEGGHARMDVLPSLGVEAVRAWNSIILDADTVLCCISEDARHNTRPKF